MNSWTDFTALAKSTLSAAQKKIDKVLDIQEQQEAGREVEPIVDGATTAAETEAETETGPTSLAAAPFNRLQEDFFAAFGLSAGSGASIAPSESKSPQHSRRSKTGGDGRTAWTSLINTFAGGSAVKESEETPAWDTGDETPEKLLSRLQESGSQEQQLFASDADERVDSSCSLTVNSVDNGASNRFSAALTEQQSDESGWSSEPLVVPATLTTITNFDNADFLTPADPSPFFNTEAHLSFVGEDEQDGTEGTADLSATKAPTECGETADTTSAQLISVDSDSVFVTPAGILSSADTGLVISPMPSLPRAERISDKSDASLISAWSAPKASTTSSCATSETEHSSDSLLTVIHAAPSFSNVPLESSTPSDSTSSQAAPSLSASTSERNMSTGFMDSAITTSSTDSNEKSVTTVLDGGEEELRKDGEEDDGEVDERPWSAVEATVEFLQRKQEVADETVTCVEKILTKVSSELEILTHERQGDFLDQTEDSGLIMKEPAGTMAKPYEDGPSAGDDFCANDMGGDDYVRDSSGIGGADIAESFVQLSRSTSNNGGGGESNEGSGHSPTQPTTCGKSSGEASADELLDDVEAATTCSDVEIISTPPYDTVSERSSRSGIVSRGAVDWSFHPPSKLFQASKDNGARRTAHRRVGSDQSLASCDSFPTGVGAPSSAISRSASFSVQDYEKKITHLTEILEARERKLLDIAKENAQLADENEQLRNELQQLHSRISRDSNVDVVQRELSERLNNVEKKCDSLTKERDALKRKCDNLEKEVASRVTTQQLKEKEEQIAELLAEGEKLSKQELKQGNVIKKLREKEKETEKQLEAMRAKLKDMDDLRQKLKEKDEQEIKYDEMVHELKSTVTRQEKVTAKLRNELEDAKDKCTSYKATLENCAKDIAELNQEKAIKDAEIQRLATRAAESKEGELQEMLEAAQQQWHTERQSLIREIQNLRTSSTQDNDEYQRREQTFRWEIAQLHKKLQETEERNQELVESITTATKPLLRQLDSMQLSFRTQQANWERVEKSLYERINEAERTSVASVEKERETQTAVTEIRKRLSQLEAQNEALLKEKNRLELSLTTAQRELENMVKLRTKYIEDLQSEKALHQHALAGLTKDKELIAGQFEYEKRQLKSQFEKTIAELTEKVNETENLNVSLRQQVASSQDLLQRSSVIPPTPFSQPLSLRISSESPPLGHLPSRTPSTTSFVQDDQHQMQYDSWPNDAAGGGYATLLERLRSRLQQREGELVVVKDEMRSLQQNRDSLAVQLIALSNSNCVLEQRVQELEVLRQQYKDLDEKYQGLLLLYGEQIERNEELQLDLQDVKAVYKEQLDALLQRPAT